jgi:Family of unknown function (DUF5522)
MARSPRGDRAICFWSCGNGRVDEPQDTRRTDGRLDPPPGALAPRPLTEPHRDRLSPGDPAYPQIIRAHAEALRAGADTYVDPLSGFTVLTAGYLVRRGSCCESGCRHCPYLS